VKGIKGKRGQVSKGGAFWSLVQTVLINFTFGTKKDLFQFLFQFSNTTGTDETLMHQRIRKICSSCSSVFKVGVGFENSQDRETPSRDVSFKTLATYTLKGLEQLERLLFKH
jgi:hypothetical protein